MVTVGLFLAVSEINDFSRKSQNFLSPVYFAGFPWNWVSAHGVKKPITMGLLDGQKCFKICLAVKHNTGV